MTSYGSQPTPQWPEPGPASPLPAQVSVPGQSPGLQDSSVSNPEWHTGPHGPWRTADREPWPDWPPGQEASGPQWQEPPPDQEASGPQWQEPPPDQEASGPQWQEPPLDTEPPSAQWSAQLRKQAPPPDDADLAGQPGYIDERWAMVSYLGVPFLGFLAPLAVYLIKLRTSHFVRLHATQALNLAITVILYTICALIVGGLLALDSVEAALVIMVPLLAGLWIVTLAYLVLAGTAASRGDYRKIPAWLCAALVH